MINLLTQLSKYVIIILAALYAMKCFTVFRKKHEYSRGSIYTTQSVLMYMIHFICYFIIFLNERDLSIIGFYLAQVVLFAGTMTAYRIFYRRAARLLVNNMCFLLMVGFVILTRLSYGDAIKQFIIAVGAVVFALFIPVIISRAQFLQKLGVLYGVLSVGLIGSVFVLGTEVYGATNWIMIGPFSFQPSEIAKIVFVFFVAALLHDNPSFPRIVVVTALAAMQVLMFVAATDLGGAVIFFVCYLFMLYVATEQFRYMALGLSGFSLAAVAGYYMFSHVRVRVQSWLNPWADYEYTGYQIAQSLFAIGTGSWFGSGLYQGKPGTIPVVVSDFVFSAISEEMGALFAICLLLVYVSCFIMFINISLQLTRPFYKLLALGLSVAYAFQIFLTVGGVIKLIPHTGVTLPLISYGGSSVLSTIIVFAVIQGLYVLKQREVYGDEKEK